MATLSSPVPFLDLAWIPAGDTRWSARRTHLWDCAAVCARPGLAKVGLEASGGLVFWDLARAPAEAVLATRLATYDCLARYEAAAVQAS
ncbi:hypothetical protein FV218_10200 [Methylobacterium sp. WL69]|uniref:hypothetical protein n=1 Tax=Methylobacterium sp. WL69 TaxID=2603893 RepID=UPI0011CA192A|nr:hypothetical protein [Methylobacterium sp. WL69]TXM74170.1 hypothetical protein FV218_10200 [Methylobacterium sp. WL69]